MTTEVIVFCCRICISPPYWVSGCTHDLCFSFPFSPTQIQISFFVTGLFGQSGGDVAFFCKHGGEADATFQFETARNSASGVKSMQEDAFWDPAPFLGRPGTVRNLFKLAAARTDPLFITTVLHFLNLAPHHPALECPSFCAELNPAVWAELQMPRPPLTEGESGVPTRLPDSFEATLNENDKRSWLVDDRRRSQRMGSRPNIVKILEAARF